MSTQPFPPVIAAYACVHLSDRTQPKPCRKLHVLFQTETKYDCGMLGRFQVPVAVHFRVRPAFETRRPAGHELHGRRNEFVQRKVGREILEVTVPALGM